MAQSPATRPAAVPEEPPEEHDSGGSSCPWRAISRPSTEPPEATAVSPRRILIQLIAAVIAVVALVGIAAGFAARALAEREAVTDAATTAAVLADAVVTPALAPGLYAAQPGAARSFDESVRDHLHRGSVVRVKLWRGDGRILYADEPALIGRTFALSAVARRVLADPEGSHAEISDLTESENVFERGDRLVEVYRTVHFPGGEPALFEVYTSYVPVGARTEALSRGFAGLTGASLVLLVLLISPVVWHLVRRLRAAERHRAALLERAVEASDAERRRIAATLHDGPVQDLAATSFAVTGAAAAATSRGDSALAAQLHAVAGTVRGNIRSLRTLLVDIYPPSLADAGLDAALSDLVQANGRPDLVAQLDLEPAALSALGPASERLIFRVAQECLRNAVKHAGPATVAVTLRLEDGVVLDVVDDGHGFDVDAILAGPRAGHLGIRLLADLTSRPGVRLDVASLPSDPRAADDAALRRAGTHWRLVLSIEVARR